MRPQDQKETKNSTDLSINQIKKFLDSDKENEKTKLKKFLFGKNFGIVWDTDKKKHLSILDFLESENIDTVMKILNFSIRVETKTIDSLFFDHILFTYTELQDSDSIERLLKILFKEEKISNNNNNQNTRDSVRVTDKGRILKILALLSSNRRTIAEYPDLNIHKLLFDNLLFSVQAVEDLTERSEVSQKVLELICFPISDGKFPSLLHSIIAGKNPTISQQSLSCLLDLIKEIRDETNPTEKVEISNNNNNNQSIKPSAENADLFQKIFDIIGFQSPIFDIRKQPPSVTKGPNLLHYIAASPFDSEACQLLLNVLFKLINRISDLEKQQKLIKEILAWMSSPYHNKPSMVFPLHYITSEKDSAANRLLLELFFDFINNEQNSEKQIELFEEFLNLMDSPSGQSFTPLHYMAGKENSETIQLLFKLLFNFINNKVQNPEKQLELFEKFLKLIGRLDNQEKTPFHYIAMHQDAKTNHLLLKLFFDYIRATKDPTKRSQLFKDIFTVLSSATQKTISILNLLVKIKGKDCNNAWLDTVLENIQDINELVELLLFPKYSNANGRVIGFIYDFIHFQGSHLVERLIDHLIKNKNELSTLNALLLVSRFVVINTKSESNHSAWKLCRFKIEYYLKAFPLNEEDYSFIDSNENETVIFEQKSENNFWIHGKINNTDFHHKVKTNEIEFLKRLLKKLPNETVPQKITDLEIIEKFASIIEKKGIETAHQEKIKNFITDILKKECENFNGSRYNSESINSSLSYTLKDCLLQGFPNTYDYLTKLFPRNNFEIPTQINKQMQNVRWDLFDLWVENIEAFPISDIELSLQKLGDSILYDLDNFEDKKTYLISRFSEEELEKNLKNLEEEKKKYTQKKLECLNKMRDKMSNKLGNYYFLNKSYFFLGRDFEKDYRETSDEFYKNHAKVCYDKISPENDGGLTDGDYHDIGLFYAALHQNSTNEEKEYLGKAANIFFKKANEKGYSQDEFITEYNGTEYALDLIKDEIILEKNRFYVQLSKDDKLKYMVIDPDGNKITDEIQKQELLGILSQEEFTQLKENFELKKLIPFLQEILSITSSRGHTHGEEVAVKKIKIENKELKLKNKNLQLRIEYLEEENQKLKNMIPNIFSTDISNINYRERNKVGNIPFFENTSGNNNNNNGNIQFFRNVSNNNNNNNRDVPFFINTSNNNNNNNADVPFFINTSNNNNNNNNSEDSSFFENGDFDSKPYKK